MKTSERIEHIKKISKNLSNYEWADIDLILNQFGLKTTEFWNGSKIDYLLQHLKDAKDAILLELASYVLPELSRDKLHPENNIWQADKFKLFISHISTDKKMVTEIKEKLDSYGIESFVAHQDITPTHKWQDTIEYALESCDAMLVFLSDNFHESLWTDQEIGFAVARRILIVPLKFGINPYGFIGKYQAYDCKSLPPAQIASNVFDILIEHPLTSAKLADVLVSNFISAGTWEAVRARSLLLKKIKIWTPEMLRKLVESLDKDKISTAFGVPERIREIVSKNSAS